MLRTITGFSLDDEGDVIAELACGHHRHVRHRPPLFPNPWVLDATERAARIGSPLACGACARCEPPEGTHVVRELGPWDEETIPAGLRHEHRTPHGGWARLVVLAGGLDFVLPDVGLHEQAPAHLGPGDVQFIPPDAAHHVVLSGPVRCRLELLEAGGTEGPAAPAGIGPAAPGYATASVEGVKLSEIEREQRTTVPATASAPTVGAMGNFGHDELVSAHRETLAAPRRHYGLSARGLFALLDLLYGRPRTLSKFKVLELVARVPYQSWEQVAYIAITHTHRRTDLARRIFDQVTRSRNQEDNEQWHLLILEEMIAKEGIEEAFWKFTVVPQMLAFAYYQLSFLLYVVHPAWSYRLNADFEDHAEHEYAHFVAEHPEWETRPFESAFTDDYAHLDSLADLFRQISYDERVHKQESLEAMAKPRFS